MDEIEKLIAFLERVLSTLESREERVPESLTSLLDYTKNHLRNEKHNLQKFREYYNKCKEDLERMSVFDKSSKLGYLWFSSEEEKTTFFQSMEKLRMGIEDKFKGAENSIEFKPAISIDKLTSNYKKAVLACSMIAFLWQLHLSDEYKKIYEYLKTHPIVHYNSPNLSGDSIKAQAFLHKEQPIPEEDMEIVKMLMQKHNLSQAEALKLFEEKSIRVEDGPRLKGHTYLIDRKYNLDNYVFANFGLIHKGGINYGEQRVLILLHPAITKTEGAFFTPYDIFDLNERISSASPYANYESEILVRYWVLKFPYFQEFSNLMNFVFKHKLISSDDEKVNRLRQYWSNFIFGSWQNCDKVHAYDIAAYFDTALPATSLLDVSTINSAGRTLENVSESGIRMSDGFTRLTREPYSLYDSLISKMSNIH